jgi:AraC family transcriptional regulator
VSASRLRLDAARHFGGGVFVRLWTHEDGRYDARVAAHDSAELAWVEEGEIIYRAGGREISVRAGEAAVIPREVEHATAFRGPTRAGALGLEPALIAEIADALGGPSRALDPAVLTTGARLAALGALIREEVIGAERGHLLAVESLAEAMTVAMLRGAGAATDHRAHARDPRVLAAIERIHAGYAEPLGIDDLARAAGMSRFHFCRLFREAVGTSPYQYLIKTRVDRAAELLRSGRASVTEVAFAVGFPDLSRFARAFRMQKGTPPGAWARGIREGR